MASSVEFGAKNKNVRRKITTGMLAFAASMAVATTSEAKSFLTPLGRGAEKGVEIYDPIQLIDTQHQLQEIGHSATIGSVEVEQLTPAEFAKNNVTSSEFREWKRVNICEEGGRWHVQGSTYSGGLGISNVNWIAYGGRRFASNAGLATPYEQVYIGNCIQPNVPDQDSCADW
jgi:hypothetical protein